ncbi:MAG: propane monooxygenase coupling protein [Gammaproteobacteria bacterium]|jgi:propane monooxygenase coupling protein
MTTQTFKDLNREDTISHRCGVTMNDSADARVIAEVMEEKPGIEILRYPAMIRLDTEGKMIFDMEEISEAIGREFTAYDFEVVMSTHYGRMVMIDENKVIVFGDQDEALQYEE